MAIFEGHPSVKGSSETMRMILLTFSAVGASFTWGVEMAYCTPYLLKLGLTKSDTSLVWIAGPLSGLVVQPVIGVISDESTSKWGRRRPLMGLGTVVVVLSMLGLGFTEEIVDFIVGGRGEGDGESVGSKGRLTIVLAVLALYVVDFAVNMVMSCARGLIVDTLPIEKQHIGAAWSSRMSSIGQVAAYAAGSIDLVNTLGPGLGDTQFKQLILIAIFTMILSNALTCWAVKERVLIESRDPKPRERFGVFSQIWTRVFNLPPRIEAICWAQFWSWIGWFPFLFYSTTWVGETYFRYDAPSAAAARATTSNDSLGEIGRIGSKAMVVYSGVTFAGAFVLPMLVQSPENDKFTPRPPKAIAGLLERFKTMKPDLLTTWICGHLLFSMAMALAPFAHSFFSASLLVCLCGLPWAVVQWAPAAFLGIEVNKISDNDVSELELQSRSSLEMPLYLSSQDSGDVHGTSNGAGELSGIYFGILNIFTTLPQFLGTFISAAVFYVLEPDAKDPDMKQPADTKGPSAISVCLFIGAISTLYAACVTRKLKYL